MCDTTHLGEFMKLDSRLSEVKVKPDVFQAIKAHLKRVTKCDNLDYRKIKRDSRIKIHLSTYFPEIFSVSKQIIKCWARSLSLVSVPGLYSDLDLENGKYEGGFKVWEATSDLVKFITHDKKTITQILKKDGTVRFLELGSGSGLASLALLSRLISDEDFKSDYRIHLQDYNWQVLASLTVINFALNLPEDYFRTLLHNKSLRFFHGEWSNFRNRSDYMYDLIMMSEAIYNSDSYPSLHDLLERHLKSNGRVVIATKDTYFGLSGGLYSWLDFVVLKNVFKPCEIIKVSKTNIPRSILILKKLEISN